jgi:CIC family chloride channel protein
MPSPASPDIVRRRFTLDENTYIILLALLVGVLGGLGNTAFRYSVQFVTELVRGWLAGQIGIEMTARTRLLLPLLPLTGALLVIPFALTFPGQIYGYGFPGFLELVNVRGGMVKKRLIIPKMIAASLVIGSGGSVGVEGPIAQLGGGLGSAIGQWLKSSATRLRVLIASGVAAGIAATFDAPITGVMFAVELVLMGDFQLQSFVALVLAAGVATVIARATFGLHPAFLVPAYTMVSPIELLSYVLLGICSGLVAIFFITFFYGTRDVFARLPLPLHLKPLIGALLMGSVAIALPQVMGNGYEFIQSALDGQLVWWLMLLLVAGKLIATSLTLGSGGVGGTFAPSLYIGTMLGGGFGALMHRLLPHATADPGAYAMVGMAGFLAATTQAPLTAAFLLFELTASYMIVLPVLFCIIAGLVVVRAFGIESIDEVELERRGINLRAGKESSILQSVKVGEVMTRDFQVIPERMPLRGILPVISGSRHDYFPVVDDNGMMSGSLTFQELREVLFEEGLKELVVAKDVANEHLVWLTPDDTLGTAIGLLAKRDVAALPVMESPSSRRVLGLVKRDDVLAAYNSQLLLRYPEAAAEH